MKPQELNQDDQKNINGGSSLAGLGLLDDILGAGSSDSSNGSSSGSHSGSAGGSSNGNSGDDSSSGLPIVGDVLGL